MGGKPRRTGRAKGASVVHLPREGYQVSTLNLARALVDPRAARGSARTVAANVSAMELKALAGAGVVRQISEGSYDRQFAATELFDLVNAYEERIAGQPR